jgi:chromosome segregation ATPase
MASLFFVLCLLCGIAVAGFCAKLFVDTRKGASFMGFTLANPQPAIVGIVLGVIVLLSALIVYFGMNSQVGELEGKLKTAEGNLQTSAVSLDGANKKVDELDRKLKGKEEELKKSRDEAGKLKKELDAKEADTADQSHTTQKLEDAVDSLRQNVAEKTREAETLATELGIVKARIEPLEQEVQQLKSEMETEKQFRRDFTALVEEEEAAPSGTVRKLYFKLRDLLNKYK